MDAFLASIQDYGYWVLIFGALIEGESILLLAGAAAYMGYFSLPLVMTVSFIGAIIHDQLLYSIGKVGGTTLLHRSKMFEKKSERAFALLKKYDHWLIMGFRFVYGIRTITPIVIGASDISFKRYTILTVISAALWAMIVSSVGYVLADIIQSLIEAFEDYKFYIISTPILLIGLGIGIYYLIKNQRSKRKSALDPESSNSTTLESCTSHDAQS
ncbi:MAG: DedA family protein [Proteobacteria bacterium]|nr:DedA family protein [Pseudomonadota bacterium]